MFNMIFLKKIFIKLIENLGVGITSSLNLKNLRSKEAQFDSNVSRAALARSDQSLLLRLIRQQVLSAEKFEDVDLVLNYSKSQLRQELFCLIQNNFKRSGFFVEFGALDGVTGSNTYVLEKYFDWSGILAEPNPNFWNDLVSIRTARVEKVAIGAEKSQSREFLNLGNLSTFSEYQRSDSHDRSLGKRMFVQTITLNELLHRNDAPNVIDFMSIDTEGSELEIVSQFNFHKWRLNFVCIEHNYSSNAKLLLEVFENNGYRQVFSEYSHFDFFLVPKESGNFR